MADNRERRYDTADVNVGKYRLPEERRRQGGEFAVRRVPRWVYRILLILALSALAVLGWYNRSNLTPSNVLQWAQSRIVGFGIGDGFPQAIAGSSVQPGNFLVSDGNLCVASDTALTVYNSTAKELMSVQHSFGNPVLKVSGQRTLLYNLGGKSFRLGSVGGTAKQVGVQQNILAGALSTDGRCAILTEADGYCGQLTVYTENGTVQSYYWFSDYYPDAVALNSDGTQAAVTGVSAQNGEMVSAVYLIDLNSGKAAQPVATYPGCLLHAVFWDGNSTVAAVGDTCASVINTASRTKKDYDYGGKQLSAYCFDGGRTVLALSSYGESSVSSLIVLDGNGSQLLSQRLAGNVLSVSLYGQTAAALADGEAYFCSLSSAGQAVKKVQAGSDAKAVALRDENSAYLLGISEIRLLNP